jgi:hypothetical protein
MELLKRTTVALAAVATLSVGLPLQARADILPAAATPTVTAVTGGFNWSYDILVTAAQEVVTGNFFTIYDFGPGSLVLAPAGWTLTTDPFAPTSANGSNGTVTPNQSSALNYTFTYTGATILGPQDLGNFVLFSTTGTSQSAAFVGAGTDQLSLQQNANITNTNVPTTTPEPASLMLVGTGMLGLVGFVRRRNKSA